MLTVLEIPIPALSAECATFWDWGFLTLKISDRRKRYKITHFVDYATTTFWSTVYGLQRSPPDIIWVLLSSSSEMISLLTPTCRQIEYAHIGKLLRFQIAYLPASAV